MQARTILEPTDIRLNSVSLPVDPKKMTGLSMQIVTGGMKQTAIGERDEQHPDKPSMVGLAAPQLGMFDRVILFDMNAERGKSNFDLDLRFIVNPEIIEMSEKEELGSEGCYSTGDICGAVYRSTRISVRGFDEKGAKVTYKLDGFLARIVQHEIDHLNGIRFPDRVRDAKHLHHVDKSTEFQKYRDDWRVWKKLCSFDEWLAVKRGM